MLIVLTPWTFSIAANDFNNQKDILNKLPGKLAKVEWKNQTPTDIEKSFGAPEEKETKEGITFYYYSFDGIKYDTSIVFKDSKLSHIVFVPGKTSLTIKNFEKYFSGTDLAAARSPKDKEANHEKGREFSIDNKSAGIALAIAENSKFSIRQVVLWEPGKVKP